jgi:hypothetical protein
MDGCLVFGVIAGITVRQAIAQLQNFRLYEERSQRCCQKGDRQHLNTGNFGICDIAWMRLSVVRAITLAIADKPVLGAFMNLAVGRSPVQTKAIASPLFVRLQSDSCAPRVRIFTTVSASKSDRQPKLF